MAVNSTEKNELESGMNIIHSSAVYNEEQQGKVLHDLYNEYKTSFDNRNFERVNRIRDTISSIKPDSAFLNLIYGQNALFNGDGESSYNYLFMYIRSPIVLDSYALSIIALWNKLAKKYDLALSQFAECMNFPCDIKTYANLVLNAADIKKSQGFFSTALEYYERLLQTPEGYKMILYIKLQIIHIYLQREDYDKARHDINLYMQINHFNFIRRLKAYLIYKQGTFRDLTRLRNEATPDPYVLYLMARMSSCDNECNADASYLYEEALRKCQDNPVIHNSFGNYLFRLGRLNDAASHYSRALKINPDFTVCINNLALTNKLLNKSGKHNYADDDFDDYDNMPEDIEPDVEVCGFFNLYELFGYTQFKLPYGFVKANFDLKPYKH